MKEPVQHTPKYLNDGDVWMLAEDIPDVDFHFMEIPYSAFVNDLQPAAGRNYKKVLSEWRGYGNRFFYGERDSFEFAEFVLGRIVKTPAYGEKMNAEIRHHAKKLRSACGLLEPKKLIKMSGKQLAAVNSKLDKVHTDMYAWAWLPNAVDVFHTNFTNLLKKELSKRLKPEEVNSALVALSTSAEKTVVQKEHESLLNLVALKQKKAPAAAYKKALKAHTARYFYLKFLWIGKAGVYNEQYYEREVAKLIRSGEVADQVLKHERLALKQVLGERAALLKKLKLGKALERVFDVYADFAVTKLYRRDSQLLWAYLMSGYFDVVSKKLNLKKIEARFMLPWELEAALSSGSVDKVLKKELTERSKYCVHYVEKGVDILVTGEEAKKLASQIVESAQEQVSEFSGQTACLGFAKGYARIVNTVQEMRKMKKGDILISIATNPDIVSAMKLAGAIVTEQGDITSHAAIVSRELNIPCIIGTKIATQILHDGDLIEVNASMGTVKILERAK